MKSGSWLWRAGLKEIDWMKKIVDTHLLLFFLGAFDESAISNMERGEREKGVLYR
jgi:hypothetical protein